MNKRKFKKNETLMSLFLLIFSISFSVSAAAETPDETDEDSTINVIAYFCKNDTMTFRQNSVKFKVENNDTTISYADTEDFMIVVTDSTEKGYRIELVPINLEIAEADTITRILSEKIWDISKNLRCVFTTDEYGSVKHIENWREIRDAMEKGIKLSLDELYKSLPMLDSIMPRKRLEHSLMLGFMTEEGIKEIYKELDMMFGIHGNSFDMATKEIDDTENGFKKHIAVKGEYIAEEDEDDFEGDYVIASKSVTLIPVEDVAKLGMAAIGTYTSESFSDSLINIEDSIKGALKAELNGNDIKIVEKQIFSFFYNGWPKNCIYQKNADFGKEQRIELKNIEWTSRAWNIYYTDEEKEEK